MRKAIEWSVAGIGCLVFFDFNPASLIGFLIAVAIFEVVEARL